MKSVLTISLLVLLTVNSFSQDDTIQIIEEVEIIEYNPNNLVNPDFLFKQLKNTSAGITQNVDLFLENFTNANVKNYGVNGSATISLDGLNPQHTQVFWNGIPVNTATIGIADISKYPFTNNLVLDIVKSTESFKYTSSQMGGAVMMENQLKPYSGVSFAIQNGSFGYWSADFSGYKYWDEKSDVALSLNTCFKTARNDYSYVDYTTNPITKRSLRDANYKQFYFQPSFDWQINQHHKIQVNALYNLSDRNLTSTVISPNNSAEQNDDILRISAAWKYTVGKWVNYTNIGYAFDNLNYIDFSGDFINVQSNYKVNKLVLNESISYQNQKHNFNIGGNFWLDNANGFSLSTTNVFHGGLFAIYRNEIVPKYWNLSASIRTDFHSKTDNGIAGNLSIDGQPIKRLPIKIKFAALRNNKFPSVNDLYFKPSGNINLEKESSWQINTEIYSEKRFDLKKTGLVKLQFNAEGYSIWLKDMIVWVPTNKIYWQPINLTKVHSKGFKTKNAIYFKKDRKWEVFYSQLYHFSSSTNQANLKGESALFPNDLTIGKQLPYIPKHQLKLNLFTAFKGVFVNVNAQLISRRYITGSNSYYLQKYWLMDAGVGYIFTTKNYANKVRFEFTIKNILNNKYYQEIAHLPMPGRNYQITIKYDFQK